MGNKWFNGCPNFIFIANNSAQNNQTILMILPCGAMATLSSCHKYFAIFAARLALTLCWEATLTNPNSESVFTNH